MIGIFGKFSDPGKMPCDSFDLPPMLTCPVGAKLAVNKDSVCFHCYARSGMFLFPDAIRVRAENLETLRYAMDSEALKRDWVLSLAETLNRKRIKWFRWHSSGDIFSVEYGTMIMEVCQLTPTMHHWIPTKEYRTAKALVGITPRNVNVRLSTYRLGEVLDTSIAYPGFTTSSIDAHEGYPCPANHNPRHHGKCGACRACWDRRVQNIDYKLH